MFAQSLSSRLARRGIHYGWVVMAVVFLTMLSSSAALGLPGVFLRPLEQEFGWNASQVSSALAVRFMLYGLLGPFAAILMQRLGLRRVVCSALALIAAGLLLATSMGALWQLFVLWGLVLGVGSGFTAIVLGATAANRWFDKRRGLVLGVLTASSATGQLIFLPMVASIIEHHGWRVAVAPIVACCLAVALLAWALLAERPSDLGLRAYGADPAAPEAAAPWRPRFSEPFVLLAELARSPAFWVLAGTFFVCGLSTNGLIQTHFIALCGDHGLGPVPAASVLAMIGAFDFIGTVCSGWLSDRFDNRKLLFWYYGLRGLSLMWLPHSTFSLYGLSLFAMFYGLDWIATVPPTVKLTSSLFDRQRAPMIFGWIFAAHQIGSATAAYGAGLARTVLLSYSPALYAAGAACIVAALAIFLVQRPGPGARVPATPQPAQA
ncbi:MAG: MFS transporter [Burkholderiales bacterium]|nr:MFS transporter [Burkholderiales bacterium]